MAFYCIFNFSFTRVTCIDLVQSVQSCLNYIDYCTKKIDTVKSKSYVILISKTRYLTEKQKVRNKRNKHQAIIQENGSKLKL